MFQGPDSLCEYPYDLAVIAEGQNGVSPKTPMLIDPKIGTNGPFP